MQRRQELCEGREREWRGRDGRRQDRQPDLAQQGVLHRLRERLTLLQAEGVVLG